jgi:ATP-dependent DNA helicase RecG
MIANRDVILSEGETYTVEFKRSADKTLPDEVCAFANASGGRVYIGITDDNAVAGTDIGNRARAALQDTINKVDPKAECTVDVDLDDRVFIVTVPEGRNKPYSSPSGYYLRVGAGKIKLTRDRLLAFIQREGNIRYDEIVRGDLPLSKKFDEKAYSKYLEMAEVSEVLNREAILENLSCIADEMGKYVFTNAGALFFRRNAEDVIFDHSAIVCALYKGMTKVHILDAQRYNSDIISNIDNAVLFLKRNLRTRYEIKSIRRKEILELPEVALKEAVVNAACHRNYFEKGANIMVEIFDDRVEITSPGSAPSGIDDRNFGRISIRRNPIIASMLHRIDYVERMGTGIGRMREAAKEAGVAEPIFENDALFRVIFYRLQNETASGDYRFHAGDKNKNLAGANIFMEANDYNENNIGYTPVIKSPIPAITGDKKNTAGDSPVINTGNREAAILAHLQEKGHAKNTELSELLGVGQSRIRELLKPMIENGIVEKCGKNKGAYYQLKPREEDIHRPVKRRQKP